MTKDGKNKEAMQNKLRWHSNVVVLVKTDENKIFGGYTSRKIEYNNRSKYDNKAFLFSLNLNKKFNIKENKYAIDDALAFSYLELSCGINFGDADLVLIDEDSKCYSFFGEEDSYYQYNGITRDEFCGGTYKTEYSNNFTPIEIEVYEIIPSGKEYSSKIITNNEDKKIFENITTNTSKMKLAYRMSENEKDNDKMIEKINDKFYNHIILIKTKNKNKFGCYFRNRGTDIVSFIFSIDKPYYFNPDYLNYNKDEIILNTNEIKIGKDLFISLKEENKSYLSIGNSYNSSGKPTKDIIKGEEKEKNKIYFEIEELEIFQTNEDYMNQILPYSSEIINEDNKNIFESLVSKTNKLQLLYRLTQDGAAEEVMQDKLKGHSNIVVLVKTNEGKIFGGYTNCKIEYNNNTWYTREWKTNNKAFLFSIDLNMKFNVKENLNYHEDEDEDENDYLGDFEDTNYGIVIGNFDLVLLHEFYCFSSFGDEESSYETNGITIDEFCGGIQFEGLDHSNVFKPVEIEAFEIKEEQNEQEDIKRGKEDNEANKKNMK